MNKHTEGPWIYIPQDNVILSTAVNRIIDVCPRSDCVGEEVRNANAQLCALSPELLNACRVAYDALRSYQYGNSSSDLAAKVCEHIGRVLGKAEFKP